MDWDGLGLRSQKCSGYPLLTNISSLQSLYCFCWRSQSPLLTATPLTSDQWVKNNKLFLLAEPESFFNKYTHDP
jgi:hypothetical protein